MHNTDICVDSCCDHVGAVMFGIQLMVAGGALSGVGALVAVQRRRWWVAASLIGLTCAGPGLLFLDVGDCYASSLACCGQFATVLVFGALADTRGQRRSLPALSALFAGGFGFALVAWPEGGLAQLGLIPKICFVGIPAGILWLAIASGVVGYPLLGGLTAWRMLKTWQRGILMVSLIVAVPIGVLLGLCFAYLTWHGWSHCSEGLEVMKWVL